MQAISRYKVTRPIETSLVDDHNRFIYQFSVGVIDDRPSGTRVPLMKARSTFDAE
jgi:hypothetical protein